MRNDQIQLEEAFRRIAHTSPKKILFACVPADGHFSPLTGLAKQLQASGYDVRWYASAAYATKLEKLEVHHYPFKKALEVTGENVDEVFPGRAAIKNPVKKLNFDIVNFFIQRGPEFYADICEIYKSFRFDLVVADCAFTGIPFITDKMNIPVLSIGVFPLVESSKNLAPNGLAITPSYTFIGRRRQAIQRFIANKILFRVSNKYMKKVMDEYGIPVGNINLFDLLVRKSTLLLQSGTPGFEYKRSDLGKNIRFIGPLLPWSSKGKIPSWFDGRLSAYKKVILVTQGTVEKDVEKLLVPTLEAFRNTDTLVIATTGGSQTSALKKRFPERNFIIEDFIPFADVMPYANAYITNGGYGGVMLGIEYQLPLVVAGVHEGKNEINARVGYFNLGINLKTERPSVLQVRNAVQEVLSNDVYKTNVIKLGKEFNSYDPNKLCVSYVKEILSRPKQKIASGEIEINCN
ncbi:MAG: glycosyltransferase [Ferruginibacter sp.]